MLNTGFPDARDRFVMAYISYGTKDMHPAVRYISRVVPQDTVVIRRHP